MTMTWNSGSSRRRITTSLKRLGALAGALGTLALLAAGSDPIAAVIQNDCAPWDGAAFRVSIPAASFQTHLDSANIGIAIWKSPNIPSSITFQFNDGRSAVPDSGAAVLWSAGGHAERLRGSVTFVSVSTDSPVDGAFDLTAKNGAHFSARFHATWNHQRMFCG